MVSSCIIAMVTMGMKPGVFKHVKCRNGIYPNSSVRRFFVPDDFVYWTESFSNYFPPFYTAPHIKNQIWADPEISEEFTTFQPKWNELDGNVNRISYVKVYSIQNRFPVNPIGRTGIIGRGLLGRWGPNHAADPIVTRWKKDDSGQKAVHENSNKFILQMVAIKRHDNNMWAIPGGMVDPGENVSKTLKREFMEEAIDGFKNKNLVDEFFRNGIEIYKGYVDDSRNTDNAWIETVAFHYHDEDGTVVGQFELNAGDDAANAKWIDIDSNLNLHANHIDIVREVTMRLRAHW